MNKAKKPALAQAQAAALQAAEYLHAEDKDVKVLITKRDKATKDLRGVQETVNARMQEFQQSQESKRLRRKMELAQKKATAAASEVRKKLQAHIDESLKDDNEED